MTTIEKASKIKLLKDDETFKEVINGVKQEQISVFTDSNSTIEGIEKAHNIICALDEVETYMNRIITGRKFQN